MEFRGVIPFTPMEPPEVIPFTPMLRIRASASEAVTALHEGLNKGISTGNFIDTKIILYSCRDNSGRVRRPRSLYANSHVLKTVPYFQDLLFGNFAESQSRDFKDPIDEEEFAEEYGYLSDSDLEDDDDERAPSINSTAASEVHPFDPFAAPGEDTWEVYKEGVEEGKVVKLPDMAFITFQAFLMYLYTGEITFAPFGSEANRRSRSTEMAHLSDAKVPRPSPKSVYRLADKYDIPALKSRALCDISDRLASCDIVEESFSKFASQYDEIRDLYIKRLAFVWTEDSMTARIRSGVEGKIKSFAKGDLEHATEMLSSLWEVANSDGNTETQSFPPQVEEGSPRYQVSISAEDVPSPVQRFFMNEALIRSIRKGIFFDRKYWARHSKGGDGLKPVYLSTTVMGDKMQPLNKLVKYLKGQNPLTRDVEGDVNVESDCGDPLPGVNDESSSTAGGEGEEIRAVFITGSFSAWKSLFFYCCMGKISFAPLTSQGVDSRLSFVHNNTRARAPPPCSPKSTYVLANLLGISPLCSLALNDIKSKITLDNVVGEVFSWVAAGEEKIMGVECDLLVSDFKNPQTIALVKEKIRDISDGSSSHRASALQLGLEKAFKLKKKKKVNLLCIRKNPSAFFHVDD